MSIKIYSTVRDRNDRLTRQKDREFVPRPEGIEDHDRGVVVDDAVHFQEIEGFGGAMTESAAWVIAQMPPMRQKEIFDAYFSGLGYNYVRIHMNSCDFSLENYSYVADNDTELKTFSIAREERYVIPALREAWKRSPEMRLYFSPWSPPAWMKTNGEMNHGGHLKPEYRALWAEYYCRFIEELEKRNCPVWGLSVQNEPMANQCFDSCVWTGREEMEFVRDYLGPALERHGFGDRKLMVFDHNRDQCTAVQRPSTMIRKRQSMSGVPRFTGTKDIAEAKCPMLSLIFTSVIRKRRFSSARAATAATTGISVRGRRGNAIPPRSSMT